MTNVATIRRHATFHPAAYRPAFRQVPSIHQVRSWSFNRPICRWLKRSTTPSARTVDQALGERVAMATAKEPERDARESSQRPMQTHRIHLLLSSVAPAGPLGFVYGHSSSRLVMVTRCRLSNKFKLRPIYFSSAPPSFAYWMGQKIGKFRSICLSKTLITRKRIKSIDGNRTGPTLRQWLIWPSVSLCFFVLPLLLLFAAAVTGH